MAPHTLKLGVDGLIYITCEKSAVVAVIEPSTHKVVDAIDSGSTNAHRLIISPDGRRLYTENEEDALGLRHRSAQPQAPAADQNAARACGHRRIGGRRHHSRGR